MSETANQPRCIGPWQAAAIVSGSMIGVGIFLLPSLVAQHTQASAPFMTVWLVGGLWALFGAISMGELGAMWPRAGGDYIYLREAFGRPWAFMSGWMAFLITFPGSIAVMAFLTVKYQGATLFGSWVNTVLFYPPIGDPLTAAHFLAAGLVVILTWINHRSTRLSAWFQLSITAIPVVTLIVAAAGVYAWFTEPTVAEQALGDWPPLKSLALGLIPVYFAYSGWNAITYVGGEVRKPGRYLPTALIFGTLVVIAVYLLVCQAYLQAIPVATIAAGVNVGVAVATKMLGGLAGPLIDGLVFVAVIGSLNATVLGGSRIYLAMARDGLFWQRAKTLHPRHGTPTWSLWLQAVWTGLLIFVGTVELLLDYTVTAMLILSIMSVGAVFVCRVKFPQHKRPYRTWGYPLVPILYLVISAVVLWGSFQQEPAIGQLLGIGFAGLGLVVYFFIARRLREVPKAFESESGLSS